MACSESPASGSMHVELQGLLGTLLGEGGSSKVLEAEAYFLQASEPVGEWALVPT